jgi:hypothetical protein
MARIGYPYLPPASPGDRQAADLTAALSQALRQIIDQLNGLSDGRLAQSTSAAPAVPTKGAYAQGDYIRNTKPTAGGPLGWVCVASGNPGTWAPVNVN